MTEGVSSLRCQYAGGMLAWHAEGVTVGVPLMEWTFIHFLICWELLEPPSRRCQYAGGMLAWHAGSVTEGVSSLRCQHAGGMLAWHAEGVTEGVSSLRCQWLGTLKAWRRECQLHHEPLTEWRSVPALLYYLLPDIHSQSFYQYPH